MLNGLEDGVFVSGIMPDGPAVAVLKVNDVVIAVDGKKVTSPRELQEQIYYRTPGDTVSYPDDDLKGVYGEDGRYEFWHADGRPY